MTSPSHWVSAQRQLDYLMLHSLSGFGYKRFVRFNIEKTLRPITSYTAAQLEQLGLSPEQAAQLLNAQHQTLARRIQRWHQPELGHFIVTLGDNIYPERLKQIASPPLVLFAKGNIDLLGRQQIAMVGCRRPSHYGRSVAFEFAKQLASQNILVTSGLAMGIDAQAHLGAMSVGNTLAVLGCGIDQIYPKRNASIYKQMQTSQNLIISEFPPGVPAKPEHFPRRNRLVSGLSLGVVVVEAAIKSGSLITARCALEQNRDVFAVPGNIFQAQSEGCHYLIQQGAKLVTCIEHILEEFQLVNIPCTELPIDVCKKSPKSPLATSRLLDSVDFDVTSIDIITERSKLPVQEVLAALLEYELRGFVASTAGGYVKLRGK